MKTQTSVSDLLFPNQYRRRALGLSLQRDLAAALGISLGKTNYCLKALVGKSLLKMQEYELLKAEIDALTQESAMKFELEFKIAQCV